MAVINGTAGDDVLTGTGGDDIITDSEGGNDRLLGGQGDDVLTPGTGDDIVNGGRGDDTLYVDRDTMGADLVDLSEGDDQVVVSGSAGQVRLTIISSGVGNGAGRTSNNVIPTTLQSENASGDLIDAVARYDDESITFFADTGLTFDIRDAETGHAFGDQFRVAMLGEQDADEFVGSDATANYFADGGAGDDILTGNDGDDVLLGGEGEDALSGGAGDDWMRAGNGVDSLLGGAGNDNLNGGRGADHHAGGEGDDTYVIDDAGDVVVEAAGEGYDTVRSKISYVLGDNLERLYLLKSGGDVNATGNALDNVIFGNHGDNVITGGGGRDILTGFDGVDTFRFTAVSDSAADAYDVIRDLTLEDVIDLRDIDASTETDGDQAFTLVESFSNEAGQLTLIYNAVRDFTWLAGDTDGDGVADFRVLLLRGDHTDFDNFLL